MEMNHILVVEDDKEIREGVKIYLQSQGYEVFLAADGIEGLEVMEKEDIHLAIVDIMMPRMDGIRMTMKLREKYDFPVIMLSAKSEEVDKIMGLNIGADDYVTKPFTPMELMARVNSQLRRYRRFMEKLEVRENVHVIGGLEINEDTVEVSIDGKPVKLTPIEYKILRGEYFLPRKFMSGYGRKRRSIRIRSWCMCGISGKKLNWIRKIQNT